MGYSGKTFLLFPSESGLAEEYLVAGFFDQIQEELERGEVQFFCLACDYRSGWLNEELSPRDRLIRLNELERYVIDEVLPLLRKLGRSSRAGGAGCGWGGFLAVTFALKHPEAIGSAISISSRFSLEPLLRDYYDDGRYFNSPLEFVPNISDPDLLAGLRQLDITLCCGTGEEETRENGVLKDSLAAKGVPARLLVSEEQQDARIMWKKWFADLVLSSIQTEKSR